MVQGYGPAVSSAQEFSMSNLLKRAGHCLKVARTLSEGIGPSTKASQKPVREFVVTHRAALFEAGVTFRCFADAARRTPGKSAGKALLKAIPRGAKNAISAFDPSNVSYHISNIKFRLRGNRPSKKSELKLQALIEKNKALVAARKAREASNP
jgi:hypothetical protein